MVGRRLLIAGSVWIAALGGLAAAAATSASGQDRHANPRPLWQAYPLDPSRSSGEASLPGRGSSPPSPQSPAPTPQVGTSEGSGPNLAVLLAGAGVLALAVALLASQSWRDRSGRVSLAAAAPTPAHPPRRTPTPPTPAGAAPRSVWRCEIVRRDRGQHTSQFCAVATEPRRGRKWTVGESPEFPWPSKVDPHPGVPEFGELGALASRLEAAGWEPVQAELRGRNRRFVWTRPGPPVGVDDS